MDIKVTNIVRECINTPEQEFDVFIVWYCYILGCKKWLLATTLPDGMYYEVTYNKAKDEFYLDAYKKLENKCIKNINRQIKRQ